MLAGMVQAPSRLAPTRNLALAQKRSRLVLQAMADTGVISAGAGRGDQRPRGRWRSSDSVPTGTYFADWVAPQAAQAFDADLWRGAGPDHARCRPAAPCRSRGRHARIGDAQAALVAMRPDGRVVAMVGGAGLCGKSPFNRATQARRQPGSAFKLFVYLAALRAGYTPDSMIEDRPITVDGWSPGQ